MRFHIPPGKLGYSLRTLHLAYTSLLYMEGKKKYIEYFCYVCVIFFVVCKQFRNCLLQSEVTCLYRIGQCPRVPILMYARGGNT